MARKLVVGFAVLALLTAFTVPAFAQGSAESSVRGNLSGSVVDSSGAVVTGAKVTITGPTGTKSDTTNQDGQFLFPLLSPGFYGVKVEKGSFKTADVKGVEVVTGKTSNVRVGMVAGQATEVVEVSGTAITVDTTSTAVAANLTDTFYQSVPVSRGVSSLFYASPGVSAGGGTGKANPSISGGTGLENLYVADGVNITDGGFGGIGVFSRVYGPLSTGINLSFVKEVQVKTGGFEAQYGKSTGGIVQIVTKTGGNEFHGSIGGFFAPEAFEATRKHVDDFDAGRLNERFNLQGKLQHQANYDLDAQVGGYVPGFKNHVFFFGDFNPEWNREFSQYAQFRNLLNTGVTTQALGNTEFRHTVYAYAGKGTWKINDNHQFEASIFGDPTYNNVAPNATIVVQNHTGDDKLQYGTRNFVVRYNGAMTPTWLVNGSFTWGHNNLGDKPTNPNVYLITDTVQRTPCGAPFFNASCTSTSNPLAGQVARQGFGYYENTQGDNYGFNLDTSKSFRFLGEHNVGIGWRFERSHYDGTKARTGPRFALPNCDAGGNCESVTPLSVYGSPATASHVGAMTDATLQLFTSAGWCGISEIAIPGLDQSAAGCQPGHVGAGFVQLRGEFGDPVFRTTNNYHSLFAQDTWSINKYVTVNAGLRWEQQAMKGTSAHYTFTDNWSPRVGISIDPWGNRKTKIFANFGRYNESIPLDMAIRSLSAEKDFDSAYWLPPTDGSLSGNANCTNPAAGAAGAFLGTVQGGNLGAACGNIVVNPDGTIPVVLDGAHLLDANSNGSGAAVSIQDHVAFAPGTRMEYLDEYVVGFEHEFGNSGVIFTARYQDRRIKRIVEDLAALSPEAFERGLTQFYVIGNPSKTLDVFQNPNEIAFTGAAAPAACTSTGGNTGIGSPTGVTPIDSNNLNPSFLGKDHFCIPNAFDAAGNQITGVAGADGVPDGFVNPVRIYKSMEFEVNKSFSKNWQLRANYRIAKLFGNYEGSFRNDNGQTDPNISSLFDFTQGSFNLLGQQFTPGVLNQDVRHLANGFVSYTFGNHYMKGLTMGTSVHFQTGIPINNLFAHPAYRNAGEVPFCADNTSNCPSARGSLGRTSNWGQVDFHADYPIRLTERSKIRLAADLFNLTDQRTQLRVDQNAQRTRGVPNADFGKPTGDGVSINPGYQRPFYARFGVKFEF